MQQRRLRPGDVLDDYCPRERRITDHAIVAMIEDDIKQTRCVVCDAEHEYKEGKVPAQRRRKERTALFTQVLDGLQGPTPAVRVAAQSDAGDDEEEIEPPPPVLMPAPEAAEAPPLLASDTVMAEPPPAPVDPPPPAREEGFFRRSLIRATLPRPEGQQPPARAIPEFTIRQPGTNGRGHQRGRRRGGQQQAMQGPMRFGRSDSFGNGHGQGQGQGQGQGRRHRRRGKKR